MTKKEALFRAWMDLGCSSMTCRSCGEVGVVVKTLAFGYLCEACRKKLWGKLLKNPLVKKWEKGHQEWKKQLARDIAKAAR